MIDWEYLIKMEKNLGLYNYDNLKLRVKWINILREIVARKCPKNKSGSSLISDVDLLTSTIEERLEVLEKLKI